MLTTITELATAREEPFTNHPVGIVVQEVIDYIVII